MDFSKFFIDRPIFAIVLSIIIFAAGLVAMPLLPVGEYPEVVPAMVVVKATYPGANPKEIADSVAVPLEEAINGVEDMIYLKSVASSDGTLQVVATFNAKVDPDTAAVRVQNRVSQALSRLPESVRQYGVTTQKQSPTPLMFVDMFSDSEKYDALYLRNYLRLHVRDELSRIPGIGDVILYGSGDYAMRLWLDPNKLAARGITAQDAISAVRRQNVQMSAGQLGAEPSPQDNEFLVSINVQGRLKTEKEFADIIVKAGSNGQVTRLSDVARVQLDSGDYTMRVFRGKNQEVAVGIFLTPGANAIEVANAVYARLDHLSQDFPEGVHYKSVWDPTVFVRESISAVQHTLFEAMVLIVLVVVLFLQTWRASIIPLVAVPVSIVGTFAFLYLFGYSVNTLTLFGLVLAIGIVVDDAIVVVENVERNMELGPTPLQAAHKAMREVSGPILAIGQVLCAVFVPMAFMSGVTG
ncbi:MAG: Efflux pump membrane transporter BepE [Stenotrophomonas maltophilia]|uniref:Efflux pump membrane transporter BepE n=1 Tax=Stenotrophomonas maltophilia TaxID=40324 RepID=A0A7V8FFX5_STEMA|nr:MAG: Efflux pump membrane transporter BepE [Stenotrophomonas maltophilia]